MHIMDYYQAVRSYKALEAETKEQMLRDGEYQGRYRAYKLRLKLPPKPRLILSEAKYKVKEIIRSAREKIREAPIAPFSRK